MDERIWKAHPVERDGEGFFLERRLRRSMRSCTKPREPLSGLSSAAQSSERPLQAPDPAGSARPAARGPEPGAPFLNFARLTIIRERLARLRTASHTAPQASSRKNPSPSVQLDALPDSLVHVMMQRLSQRKQESLAGILLELEPGPGARSRSNGSMLSSNPPVALTIGTVPYFKLYI